MIARFGEINLHCIYHEFQKTQREGWLSNRIMVEFYHSI